MVEGERLSVKHVHNEDWRNDNDCVAAGAALWYDPVLLGGLAQWQSTRLIPAWLGVRLPQPPPLFLLQSALATTYAPIAEGALPTSRGSTNRQWHIALVAPAQVYVIRTRKLPGALVRLSCYNWLYGSNHYLG